VKFISKVVVCVVAGMMCTWASAKAQSSASAGAADSSVSAKEGSSAQPASAVKSKPRAAGMRGETGKVGIAVNSSTLGVGFETGVSIGRSVNVRGGANFFNYSRTFNYDGISYKGNLNFRNSHLLLDWFPFHKGFRLSGGALVYNGNKVAANASAPAGQSFTLGSNTYYSGNGNPLTGNGSLAFRKAAPMVSFGFGNIVPRTRHFSFGFEAGVAFVGIPKTKLALTGTACTDFAQTNCVNAATDPGVQSDIVAQQNKLNNKAKYAQYWPVVGLSFGYRF
jgi:hypothetical protein